MCFDTKINDTLQKLAVEMFGKAAASARQPTLPTLDILNLQKRYSSVLRKTILMMQRHHIPTCGLLVSRKWISVDGDDKPCVTYEAGDKFVEPYHDICADLQPVLKARDNLDCFCTMNEFNMPNMNALRKCLLRLGR